MDYLSKLLDLFADCPADDEEIESRLNNMPTYFEWANGETRYAIWYKDWDFVLKIPRYNYCENNYCEIECQHYESAKQYGVDKICLPIELFHTNKYGVQFYKQTRYTFDSVDAFRNRHYGHYLAKRHLPKSDYTSLSYKIRRHAYDGHRINEKWMARVLQLYGKKFCRSFEEWTYANEINDLHDGNTGWLNNKPILLDYAGYHDF